jgi:purine-binding chemotaxis protein CheW
MSQKRIDWDEVKRRLAVSQEALERALAPTAADLEALYRDRAAQLARRRDRDVLPNAGWRVLEFTLRTERYALPFADLVELLPFTGCTPVPAGPAPLLGVLNVHGALRSVVDLARLLELPGDAEAAGGYVLLLSCGKRQAALRVDGLERSRLLPPADVTAPAETETGALPFLQGLTPDGVRMLNTDALLNHALFRATLS